MCGIVGIWNLEGSPIDKLMLERFTDSLVHRGPDSRGIYFDSQIPLGFGHRRLAILDLSPAGHQPMSYGNGRYWITYNGEIYNFIELRKKLEGLGHQFVTDCDTEVILAAYVQWGDECQLRFNGMWAFAIWDSEERVLFLSRDRFGIKPLHYFYDGRRFAFASEMKAFLTLKWFRPSFDPHIIGSALTSATAIEGTTDGLLQGIKRLRGGHCLTLREGQTLRIRRWWNTLEHLETVPANFNQQIERWRELFFDACKIRMRSDVPLGTALSGGLDSSSVLCAMAQIKSQFANGQRLATDWQKAFVATFPGTTQDERKYAEQVIRHTEAMPLYKEIDPSEVIKHLDEVLFQFEEIYDIPSAPWLIYRELRREGIVVSMDGHGADELLAGYHHYPEVAMREALTPWPQPRQLLELKATLRGMYPEGRAVQLPSLRKMMNESLLRRSQNFKSWPIVYVPARFIYRSLKKGQPKSETSKGFNKWLRVEPNPTYWPDFEADQSMLSGVGALNRRLYYDFHFTILPTILRNFDRLSMAHGVEIRAPFMDWRVVCYAFSLPATSKIGGGFSKRILREAMRGVLPESIRTRTSKVGFASPLVDWFKGPIKPFVLDSVNSQAFLQSEIWNGPLIRDFVEECYAGEDFSNARRAWEFIQAMRLMELFKNKGLS